jgi:DNA polymerase III delta prime subunit
MQDQFLWVEKYRPKTIEQCILPKQLKDTFQQIVDSGELPNLMFTGTAGLGKTTVARALCEQLGIDYIVINGSEEGNIDTLRTKIRQFASTVSLAGGYKCVILDEADYLNPQSTQPALRGFIEEFANNCRFILTCNFKNRIIEPLHSRCGVIDFKFDKKMLASLCGQFLNRLKFILTEENISFEEPVIAELIMKHAPDWRRVLNEAQRYSIAGSIDEGVLVTLNDKSIKDLMSALKAKNFKGMREWVVNNIDTEPHAIFRKIYDNLNEYLQPQSIPQVILTLADYQYKNAFVADHELNVVACMTEVMATAEWK